MGRSQSWGAQKPWCVDRCAQAWQGLARPSGFELWAPEHWPGGPAGGRRWGPVVELHLFFFPIFVPQENGSSSQQMDDLFDILIQSGGKARTPELPPQLPSFSIGGFLPVGGRSVGFALVTEHLMGDSPCTSATGTAERHPTSRAWARTTGRGDGESWGLNTCSLYQHPLPGRQALSPSPGHGSEPNSECLCWEMKDKLKKCHVRGYTMESRGGKDLGCPGDGQVSLDEQVPLSEVQAGHECHAGWMGFDWVTPEPTAQL